MRKAAAVACSVFNKNVMSELSHGRMLDVNDYHLWQDVAKAILDSVGDEIIEIREVAALYLGRVDDDGVALDEDEDVSQMIHELGAHLSVTRLAVARSFDKRP